MPTIIDNGTANTVVVERVRNVSATVRSVSTVRVASPGPQGTPGAAGASGAGMIAPINFSYGDASPTTIYTLPEAAEIVEVSLQIDVPFDGVGARIALGIATGGFAPPGPEALIPFALNDPSMEGVFEYSPRAEYAAGANVILTIDPGEDASTGSGQIVLLIVPLI